MKVIFLENQVIVYLKKEYSKIDDIKDKILIEKYFKKLLLKLKKRYLIDVTGFYNVKVYIDNRYGMVIEFYKLDSDFIFLPNDIIDLKITFYKDAQFYLELDNNLLIKDLIYLKKNNKYFVDIADIPTSLIEQGTICYKLCK